MHEAILGSGNFIVPLIGGWTAERIGSAAAPYWIAAAILGLGLVVQGAVFTLRASRGD